MTLFTQSIEFDVLQKKISKINIKNNNFSEYKNLIQIQI